MYIQTEFGIKKVSKESTETIILDFYGEGLHETLSNVLEDLEEIDLSTFKTEEARVYWS